MKLKNLLIGLLAIVPFVACEPETPETPAVTPVLELSSSKYTISSLGDEKVLYVTANNAWTIEADVDWISFSQESGEAAEEKQMVKVYIDPNPAQEARNGKITVKSSDLTKEIPVTQAAVEFVAELEVSAEELSAVAEGEDLTFTVTSNVAWAVSSEAAWLTFSPANGQAAETAATVTVTVAASDVLTERTAVITVSGEGVEETISLSQAGKPLAPETMEGAGTEASPYLIKTVGNMLAMRDAAVVDGTTYFRLENDIDMAPVKNWIPINFDGTFSRQIHFDGGNFTLKNFAPETWNYEKAPVEGAEGAEGTEGAESAEPVLANANYHSLFGVLYGSVKNLKIDNVTISGSNPTGVIGGYVGTGGKPGLVENVTISNAKVTNAGDRAGGVCGNAKEATFKNVSFQGTVTSTYTEKEAKSGGFVGQTETSAVFEGCSADVVVTGDSNDIGGFVGKTTGKASFKDCNVKVILTSNKTEKCRVGGFIGWNSTSETTINNCHVLAGSFVSTPKVNGTANAGGFIGFGDTNDTVLTIENCSAKASVDVGTAGAHSSAFIATVSYKSVVTIKNSFAEGNVSSAKNYVGGLVGYIGSSATPTDLTVTGCYFKGQLTGASGLGGLIGGVEGGKAKVEKSYMKEGSVTPTGHNSGGIVGLVNGQTTVENCWANLTLTMATSQFGGGIVGGVQNALVVKNCYALGEVNVSRGAGGIVGQVKGAAPVVEGCIAWNSIKTNRSAAQYSPGAIVGNIQIDGTYKKCYRKGDMSFTDVAMTLVDHDDIENGRPALPVYEGTEADHNQYAYHGKAADSTDSLSAVAQTIGWSTDVWDFSGALPVLK